jgi:hypothetical protein
MLHSEKRRAVSPRGPIAFALAFLMALSLLMSSVIRPAAFAAVDENGKPVFCGKTAHKHSEACYSDRRVLICGQEETGHHHSDACYAMQDRLICGQVACPPHHHSEACFADVEVLVCTNSDPEHVHTADCYRTEHRRVCGKEETDGHTHTAECYVTERVLVCGKEERDGHIHSDACWKTERVLSCGLSEHKHTLECYSDRSAVETEADWRRSVSGAMITGHWDRDLVAVAKTQIGYAESTRNYIVRNGVKHGYTRYGDWIDNSESVVYGNWCASFVAFCMHYANIRNVPISANCATWVGKLIDAGLYHDFGTIVPKAGDLVFFYSGKEDDALKHKSSHMGIVVETSDTGFITIEGNVGPVSYREYEYVRSERILGFGRLPDNPDYRKITGSRGRITFSGVIPKNTEAQIRPLTAEELERYDLPEGRLLFAFEVSLLSGGKEVKPRGAISVEIEAPGVSGDGLQVIHIRENKNGRVTERYPVEMLKVSGGTVSFIDFSIARYIAVACPPAQEAEQP